MLSMIYILYTYKHACNKLICQVPFSAPPKVFVPATALLPKLRTKFTAIRLFIVEISHLKVHSD